MTDWKEMVSGEELIAAAAERKTKTIKKNNVKSIDTSRLIDEGWSVVKTNKKGLSTLEKSKKFSDAFEDEVWMIFYNMGFKILNKSNNFIFDFDGNTKQVDVVAIDDETCIFVECKATEDPGRKGNFKQELESINGYYNDACNEIRKQYGNKKFRFIFATKNYLIEDDSADDLRMKKFNIIHFDEDAIDYYRELTDHLKTAARYQFLGYIFCNQKIQNLDNSVPAIQGKMGGHTYYSFLIEPEKLLKMAYVLHRNRANRLEMKTYQRLIKKDRLNAIRAFIKNDGFFPNSLIVSIDTGQKGCVFNRASQGKKESRIGTLILPQTYHSIYVIDGQHRLYGYSDSVDSGISSKDVIPVIAFVDLPPDEQVKMFMDINENQKKVSKSLRNTLNIDILGNSSDPKDQKESIMLRIAEDLGEAQKSPLYGRVVTGENTANDKRCITTEYLKDSIKNSGFLNEYDKKGIKKAGTFEKGNVENTYSVLFGFLCKCLGLIKEYCNDEWEEGANGYLTINNTMYAIIKIINDFVNMDLSSRGKSNISSIDEEYRFIENYLLNLVEAISKLDVDMIRRIKKAKGGGAKKESWLTLAAAVHDENPDYIFPELQDFIDEHLSEINPQTEEYLQSIEKKIRTGLKEALDKNGENLLKKIPNNLQEELVANLAVENLKRQNTGQSEINIWDLVSFQEIIVLATHGSNWSSFAQQVLTRPNIKSSQANTIEWIRNLMNYKKKHNNGTNLTKKEFEDLEQIYKDFCGENDGTNC